MLYGPHAVVSEPVGQFREPQLALDHLVVGQVLVFAAIVSLLASIVRVTSEPTLPEHVAIERWIAENTDRHDVVRWHPTQPAPDGEGLTVEVEYRYAKDSPRTVTTRRTFRVAGEVVSEVAE